MPLDLQDSSIKRNNERCKKKSKSVNEIPPPTTYTKNNTKGKLNPKNSKKLFQFEQYSFSRQKYVFPCTFCGGTNHSATYCWKRKTMLNNLMSFVNGKVGAKN